MITILICVLIAVLIYYFVFRPNIRTHDIVVYISAGILSLLIAVVIMLIAILILPAVFEWLVSSCNLWICK